MIANQYAELAEIFSGSNGMDHDWAVSNAACTVNELYETTEERNGMRRERDLLLAIMRRLYVSMEETRYAHPDAPEHSHDVPGRWDHDGSECARCKAWSELKVAIGINADIKEGGGGE